MRRLLATAVLAALAVAASADDAPHPAPGGRLESTALPATPPGPDPLASEVFGAAASPSLLPPHAVGSYSRGCLTGARAMPADGPTWQVMRPSRNRAWGHPALVDFLA